MRNHDHSAAAPYRHLVHDAIRDFSYHAAQKVAKDEHYARLIAEAAQSRPLTVDGVSSGWRQLFGATRQLVGEVLGLIGTRLQGLRPASRSAGLPAPER